MSSQACNNLLIHLSHNLMLERNECAVTYALDGWTEKLTTNAALVIRLFVRNTCVLCAVLTAD